jgi:hypothetical protein
MLWKENLNSDFQRYCQHQQSLLILTIIGNKLLVYMYIFICINRFKKVTTIQCIYPTGSRGIPYCFRYISYERWSIQHISVRVRFA